GLSDPTAQFPAASPTVTTVYTVVADDGTGCTASDTVTVEVNPLPTAFAGFNQGVCAGSNAQLNATGGVTYQWTPTTGLSDPNIANPVVTFTTDSATYYVTVTDIIGCMNTDSVTVWQEQLPDATAGPDTTICLGESANLIATGGTTYSWDPAAGLNDPTIANPTATPLTTTTYTVTVGQPTGNLVFNGDFTQGNVGFNSDYTYATQLNPEGLYSVVADANTVHNAFQGIGNTGNAPLDSFMVVNGAGTPNQNVWCQTVSVSPNTDYYFGSWVSTVVANSPAILQFSINGQTLGTPFTAPFNINNWIEFSETWNSGNETSATICVVNQNTNTGGNDFALDDISFSTICTNTAEVTVTVNPLPVADAGADQPLCVGDTTQLNATGGGDYQWVPPIGLTDPTSATTDASPTTTTVYTVVVTDNIGCSDMDEMTLTVNPLPNASAGPDQELCIGESVILQGSGGTDYQWNPPTFLDDPTAQLPTATAETTTTYTVTVTDINSCANEDEMTVTVNALPQIDAGVDSLICENGTIILQATGGDTYLWTPLIGLSDPQSATPTASPQDSISYFLTGTDGNGCVNTDFVTITIFSITAGPDGVICLNDSIQAFVSGGATYLWTPTAGVSDPTSGSPFLFPEISTAFMVTVTSEFGCVAEADVNIDILTLPVASFEARFDPGCEGIFADLSNSSENSETCFWVFGNGNSSSETDPTTTFAAGFGSVITLYAYNNDSLCVDSTTVDYSGQWFGNDTIEIVYPNVFTPNFDGINDCFKPGFDGRFSECYELEVYNRWGELIFQSTAGQEHCWNGRTKGGRFVPEGTYYYISKIRGYEKAGYVTLLY
ncbi:MAG: gliding motility-associated C-terminal domain-containing protein, partial [Flavobacteriales bacterium]|nr:gliding motility-associated C-terminal domain-containing protein [Flavobacteriales bacterium]